MHRPLLQEQRLQETFETQHNIPIYSVLRRNHVMPLDAKRHQNTAALSIHGVGGGGDGKQVECGEGESTHTLP